MSTSARQTKPRVTPLHRAPSSSTRRPYSRLTGMEPFNPQKLIAGAEHGVVRDRRQRRCSHPS